MRCIGLDQLRAAKAHSEFILELVKNLQTDLEQIGYIPIDRPGLIQRQQQLWQYLKSQGSSIIGFYIQALLEVPQKDVAKHFTDVIVCLTAAYLADGEGEYWLRNGLVQVPITVFTEENK